MNKERILILATLLEKAANPKSKPRFGFNMSSYSSRGAGDNTPHNCGTAACIAGWALGAFDPSGPKKLEREAEGGSVDVFSAAKTLLDLSHEDAEALFFPSGVIWHRIAPKQAAATLRHLAETGQVAWWLADQPA